MKNCVNVFLYAAALLIFARLGSDAIRLCAPTALHQQYAEVSSDWSEGSEETEEDTSFEDDFTAGNIGTLHAIKGLSLDRPRSGHIYFKEHISEIVPPPPQS